MKLRSTLAVAAGLALAAACAQAGTTGRITGRVVDSQKKPLVGVNISVVGQRIGAFTDADGRYLLLNVPAGATSIRAALIGYRAILLEGLDVSADQTTTHDFTMNEAPVEMTEIVVSAKRAVIDVQRTSSMAALSRAEIEALPVQELQEIVNLQAGVVDGHFRGGRLGEVQFQVDGVSVNNSFNNAASLRLDRSLLEEVQVISGTFDAEYGQAMSGVVNAVLRRGTEKFESSAEAYTGGYWFPGAPERVVETRWDPADVWSGQVTVSGPAPPPKTFYLLSLRRFSQDDYLRGIRKFVPSDSSDFENKIFFPSGDHDNVPLGFTREWSGAGKVTNRSLQNIELSYEAIVNWIDSRGADWAYRLNPDGLPRQHTFSIAHGFEWTHTLAPSRYYSVSARHNHFDYVSRAYTDLFDERYDAAGPPRGDGSYERGAYVQGVSFDRFVQITDALLVKTSYVNQVSKDVLMKLGFESQASNVLFGAPGYLAFTTVNGVQRLVRHHDEPPNYPAPAEYHPVSAATYAHVESGFGDLLLRAGLRAEYFDAHSTLPGDLANPANSIAGQPAPPPARVTRKLSVSPRLGVSFPVAKDAALHFSYGHFTQLPSIGQIFTNADYSILKDLQAGGISYGVLGNPDIRPERTTQYQFGYKQAVTEDIGLDATVFYKDVRDLLGVEFISTYNGAEYARLTNVDYGGVLGFTLALDHRRFGPFVAALDYTWQSAQGNASDPRETATRAEAGEDPRPRQVPFVWDQRHTVNLSLATGTPKTAQFGTTLRLSSGQPYTPTIETGFGGGLEANSARKPASIVADVRMERPLKAWGRGMLGYVRVYNAFDAKFRNGFVFTNTGSPYYSRYPTADDVTLHDPTRFAAPRRIEIGVRYDGQAK